MKEPSYTAEVIKLLDEAVSLKAAGNYKDAVSVLEKLLEKDPDCAPAYNNLGAIFFACKNYDLALEAYQSALDIRSDYVDVYYNLGLTYKRLNYHDESEKAYRALIALVPAHPGAHFQLGCHLMQRRKFQEAADEFRQVSESHPSHFESLANLAVCFLHLGHIDQAARCYLRALDIVPDDADILFNLGVIHMQNGYTQDGIQYYLRAIKARPDYFDAHHNLGAVYLMRRDHEKALLHYREALRIKPEAIALRHTIQILMHDKRLTGSAPEYIQSLFDSYADYYDAHLLTHLHYQVPHKLQSLLIDAGVLPAANLSILDIGCGTGLCGELMRPYARRLVGVDLSTKMLEVAGQKQIYDELVESEVVAYLSLLQDQVDLILAGDVLVYFGDLDKLIAAVSRGQKPLGYFAFNVELTNEADYALTTSGRFAHHQDYLYRLAGQYGYTPVAMIPDVLRQQEEAPVQGYLCLWQLKGSGVL